MASVSPAERKLVTVLFGDLAGSTDLVRQHDAEHVRALLGAFFEEMRQRIEAFGGTIEKYAGDAIMAVFGVPAVHEDDAERAVRAAFAMQDSLTELNPMFEAEYGVGLSLRIGIATGEGVAATERVNEFMVTGEVANLAARLQAVAAGVVVSEATYRLLRSILDAEPVGPFSLKGFSKPVNAWVAMRLRSLDDKARGIPGLSSPVVGRDAEVETLRRAIDDLSKGRGQIVSIVGEAGIGKSRLKIDLRDGPLPGLRWLEGRCYAYTENQSYAPFVQVLRKAFQLSGSEPAAIARTKLRAGLRSIVGADHERACQVMSHLLGIPVEPGRREPPLDPRAFQSQLVMAIRGVIEGLLARSPVVLAFEDLHWADTESVELLVAFTELTDARPLMMLTTSRPDVEGRGWDFRFHVQRNYAHRLTEMRLMPLGALDTERLVANLLRVEELPTRLRGRLLERSEGNPFYLEEIIRSLIETGTLRRDGDRWIALHDPEELTLPDTLREMIAARIDRLPGAAKATLQHAAVIGRVFGARVLQAFGDDEATVDRALVDLLRAELIREHARTPEREYIFKHALTLEVADASLLGEVRRALHRAFAVYLESTVGDRAEHASTLAHHWLAAEEWANALASTLKAAKRAATLYATSEAINHFWRALSLFERLSPAPERRRAYVDTVLSLVGLPGWHRDAAGQREGLRHVDVAIGIAADLGEEAVVARLEGVKGLRAGDEELMRHAVARADAAGNALAQAATRSAYGMYLGMQGRYETALGHYSRAIEIFGAAGMRYLQAVNMNFGGRCYSARTGRLEEALRYAAEVRTIAEGLDDPRLRTLQAMEAEPLMYLGRWADVVRVAEEHLPLAWEIREGTTIYFTSAWAAIAYLKLGRPELAEQLLQRVFREGLTVTFTFETIYVHIALAKLQLHKRDLEAALATARKAIELADTSGYLLERGASRRVLGEVHGARGEFESATSAFQQSIEILEAIESRPELAQSLLAYGCFVAKRDAASGNDLIRRALSIFESVGATGWVEEARAALTV